MIVELAATPSADTWTSFARRLFVNAGQRGLASLLAVGIGIATASASEVVVTPIPVVSVPVAGPTFNDPLAANTWLRSEVRSGSSAGVNGTYPHSGNGSAFLSGTNGSSKADMQFFPTGGFGKLGDLSTVSYQWYRDALSTNPSAQAPALRLVVQHAAGGGIASLIYEPTYNGAGSSVPTNSWQSSGNLDLTHGIFWLSQPGTGLDDSSGNSFTRTISDFIAGPPNGSFTQFSTNDTIVGINFGFGSGWNGTFQGAVDNVTIGMGNQDPTTWNFELSAAPVPEPASLAVWGAVSALGAAFGWRRRRTA